MAILYRQVRRKDTEASPQSAEVEFPCRQIPLKAKLPEGETKLSTGFDRILPRRQMPATVYLNQTTTRWRCDA
jgi:hypothetical protein